MSSQAGKFDRFNDLMFGQPNGWQSLALFDLEKRRKQSLAKFIVFVGLSGQGRARKASFL